jgi:hypothetical protein
MVDVNVLKFSLGDFHLHLARKGQQQYSAAPQMTLPPGSIYMYDVERQYDDDGNIAVYALVEGPDIPWKQFFGGSKALYPQCYWRAMLADKKTHKEVPTSINGGTPTKAIARGMAAWTPAAQGRPIIPMAGEIDLATAAEIKEYAQRLIDLGVKEAHFYADLPNVPAGVLNAIKAL